MEENSESYRSNESPHLRIIKDCYVLLTSSLKPDKKLLVDLQNEEILTQEDVDQILKCRDITVTEGSRKLIKTLLRDPEENHFHQFLKILKHNGQERLCQELIQKYEPWQGVHNPLAGIFLKTEKVFVESVREKYKSQYQFIPRKPWINKDFIEVDKLFVSLELVTENKEKHKYKQYCDIFADKSVRSNRYVITGGPGAGKSTLTCKIAFDWSVGRLNRYVCVMLIKAREIPSDVNLCEYIAQKFVPQDKYNPSICDSVYNLIQSGQVMLLIDGFDEFRYFKDQSHEIMKIINGDMFPTSPVIITTRPHYLPYLEHNPVSAMATLSICGFGRADVKQYIKLYFSLDKSKSTDEIAHIVTVITDSISKVHMWNVVATPMICLLICFLYEHLQTLPHRRVDVYVQLLNAFKKVYQGRETGNRPSDSDWEGIIIKVGQLALDMLVAEEGGRLVFKYDELSKYINPKVACKTGLINLTDPAPSQGVTDLIDDVKWYQFLHKSVQEYLAAYYIHQSGKAAVEKLMHYIKDTETLRSVFEVIEFVIGLQSNHIVIDELLGHIVSVLNSDETLESIKLTVERDSYKNNLWCNQMKLLNEAGITHKHVSNIKVLFLDHDKNISFYCDNYISGLMKSHNVTQETHIPDTPLRYVNLGKEYTPSTEHLTSLCSVISVSRDLRFLVGWIVPVPDMGVWLVPDKHPHLEVIDLPGCKLSSQSLYSLISNLHKWTHLKKVNLWGSKIDPVTVTDVDIPQSSESLTSLTHINLWRCNITPVLPLVSHAISLCTNLRVLDLTHTTIDMESVSVKPHHSSRPSNKLQALSQYMKRKFNIHSEHNESQSVSIFTSISNTIEVLDLLYCRMNTVTVHSLCKCLPKWTQLCKLALCDNDLSEVEHLLIQSLPVSIQELHLEDCKLTNEVVTTLSQCLSSWQCLKKLELKFNSLSGLGTHMSLPQSIEVLDLELCELTSDDMCAVARQLPHLTHIRYVKLDQNPQTDVTVWDVFVQYLSQCRYELLEVYLNSCGADYDSGNGMLKGYALIDYD